MELPVYRFVVSDEDDRTGVDAVALVDDPAIELNWQAFNSQYKSRLEFRANEEKRIISGPLMVADLPIFRRDENGKEYYGLFTAKDIYNVVKKYFKNNHLKDVNMMHDSSLMLDGVYMIESFIIDSKRGINAPIGYELTDGSWFGSFKVDNEEVWTDFVKTGKFKGFSVEGMFDMQKIDIVSETDIQKIIDVVKEVDESKMDEVLSVLKKATRF